MLKAQYTRTTKHAPLVVLEGGPFNGMEATPAQLRALAELLNKVAAHAEARPCVGRMWAPATERYATTAWRAGA
ncbi:hypothetical protein [Acidovorax sp. Root219]|uniref:hypothetical protein n=1 Tax=Acidovorax sp. Root219 TaxID=1736493 RepID=UPI00070A3462|nr:hypothetical protein [Acidovorax sp. Root219]KRC20191.1 hypothetical protein ASE28_28290 [Acidovorax sp. Root219]